MFFRGVTAVPNFPVCRRGNGRRSTIAIAGLLLAAIAGCQTPRAPATYPTAGQQPAYGGWATQPQGAAYPAGAPVMPGPATQPMTGWPQQPAPMTNMMPPSQPPAFAPTNTQAIPNTWQQAQTNAANQFQQMGNQAQQQANQAYANAQQQLNQFGQQVSQAPQQYMNQAQQQAQQYMNQAQQGMNQAAQQANQQVNQAFQAGQQQVAQYPPQQPVNTSLNPFATPAGSLPPARATPVAVPRY
jgi:hypothetical protein